MHRDSQLLIGVHRIVKDLDRETTRIAAAHGLTFPQFMVLEALLHKEAMSVGEIKDAILSSDGTIPVIIRNLEKDGLVSRQKDDADRRRSMVSLTTAGRELIERVCPENERMFSDRFSIWTDEQKRQLIGLIGTYHAARKTHPGDKRGGSDAEVR